MINMKKYIMALDAGTTSNRCMLFDKNANICSVSQREFTQMYPHSGWVEHDPYEIFNIMLGVARDAILKAGSTGERNCGCWHYESEGNNGCVG